MNDSQLNQNGRQTARLGAALFVGLLCIAGCRSAGVVVPPPDATVLCVPPVTTRIYGCGVGATLAVLRFYGREYGGSLPGREEAATFRNRRLVSTIEIVRVLRRHGVSCSLGSFAFEDIVQDIAAGHPCIVLVPGVFSTFDKLTLSHCWVIRGIDKRRKTIYYNSPDRGPLAISVCRFKDAWQRGGRIAIRTKGYPGGDDG